jgi:phosphatidylserine decarboxylase
MRPNTRFGNDNPKQITLVNTNTGKKVETEVASMNDNSITVFLANEKIVLYKKGTSYVGNKFGMELVYTP